MNPNLASYDVILVNSSAGKDSQAMLDYLVERAALAGVVDRLVVVHADLGRVEWKGTRELAEEQTRHYGLRFEVPFKFEKRASNGRRRVDMWLPIHGWTVEQVWDRIRASGVRHHPAYNLGIPRLSCVFCIYAPRDALLVAGKHNPELLDEYVRVEQSIGHDFKHRLPIASIRDAVLAGEQPTSSIQSWCM